MICKVVYKFQDLQKKIMCVTKVHGVNYRPGFIKVGRWEEKDKS